ncbi:hypothetical protein LCGC14_2129020, partial [marine sediment metagenome]
MKTTTKWFSSKRLKHCVLLIITHSNQH